MKKRDFLALHTFEVAKDPKTGRDKRVMRYIGPLYPIDLADLRKRLPIIWGTLAAALAAFVTAGCIPSSFQRCWYALPQYLFALLPLYYGLMAAVRLTRVKRKLIDEAQKQEGVESIQHAALGLLLAAGAWMLGQLLMMILRGLWSPVELLAACCAAMQTLAAMILWQRTRTLAVGPAQSDAH